MFKLYSYKIISSKGCHRGDDPDSSVHRYQSKTFEQTEMKNLKISKSIVQNHEEILSAIPGQAVLETRVNMIVEDPANL